MAPWISIGTPADAWLGFSRKLSCLFSSHTDPVHANINAHHDDGDEKHGHGYDPAAVPAGHCSCRPPCRAWGHGSGEEDAGQVSGISCFLASSRRSLIHRVWVPSLVVAVILLLLLSCRGSLTQADPPHRLHPLASSSSNHSSIPSSPHRTMVSASGPLWRLSGLALMLNLHVASTAQSADYYTSEAVAAIGALNQNWYDRNTGLWNNAWWNSANALTTLADFASMRLNEANSLNIGGLIENTYSRAQVTTVQTFKTLDADGLMTTQDCLNCTSSAHGGSRRHRRGSFAAQGFANFINDYYDDEGWWALALIHSFDVTRNHKYLDSAVSIFADMQTGQGTPCHGGIYWDKSHSYVNAIANELYLAVAAALANRVSRHTYLPIAQAQWSWFRRSGMINAQNLVNDGLDSNCANNGLTTWSYNQGVILGALVELARATGDRSLVDAAVAIAHAAIAALSNPSGILVEADQCELKAGSCGADGQQFKGVFLRNLRYLHAVAPSSSFAAFIRRNADSIWANDRDQGNRLGVAWAGPYLNATGPSHSSALDCLVSALAV